MEKEAWIRLSQITERYSLKRTFIYKLVKNNQIQTRLLSPKLRIFSVTSIEDYIYSSKKG